MKKHEAYGYVQAGRLKLANGERFKSEFTGWPDCDVTVIVKKRGKRSNQQNDYYHGVVVEEIRLRLQELGHRYDHDTVHEWLKSRFNPQKVVIEGTGEVLEIPGSTTEMNKEEMSEYIERIIEWCAVSLDLAIPPPNTQTQLFAA